MASSAFSFRLPNLVNPKNEVVLAKGRSSDLVFGNSRFKNLVKEVAFPVLSLEISRNHGPVRHAQRFVVMNMSYSQAEPQPGVAPAPVAKEVGSDIVEKNIGVLDTGYALKTDGDGNGGDPFDGSGGNGKFNNGGGGDGGDGDKGDQDENEFGPIMKFEDVIKETEARGVTLPLDMLEAAKSEGIRKLLLFRYLDLQGSSWPLGYAMKSWAMLRNRMLVDPSFLFKIGTEIVIDTCCATFAEVQKRGKDFWAEFELYVADCLVGVVVNIALVGMLAPYARFGNTSVSQGGLGRMLNAYAALPSCVFEAGRFSVNQRIASFFYKGVLYAAVGFGCGIIGQGIANMIMTAKRSIKKSEDDIPVPPLLKSAALWGFFLSVSSNTRYQVINGLERVVEASPLAKRLPPVALAFTVGVRFANNIYGGMQFVDWARLWGVQ